MFHRIAVHEDNTVKISANCFLFDDLNRRSAVEMWMPDISEWDLVDTRARLSVDSACDTVLLKGLEVGVTIGLGRELIMLENSQYIIPDLASNSVPVTREVRRYLLFSFITVLM